MIRTRCLVAVGWVSLAAAPLPAFAQKLGGGTDREISLVRILASLILCVGVAFALALLMSKRGVPRGLGNASGWLAKLQRPSRITIIEARRLSPHADLCIVRCDGREYVLTCAQGEVRVLSEGEIAVGGPAGPEDI